MLLPFFQWCETVWLGRVVVESLWLFPVIEAVHLLALSVLGGAVLIVDLRMLGAGLTHRSVPEIARSARPYLIGALAGMIVTGIPLFLSSVISPLPRSAGACGYPPLSGAKVNWRAPRRLKPAFTRSGLSRLSRNWRGENAGGSQSLPVADRR